MQSTLTASIVAPLCLLLACGRISDSVADNWVGEPGAVAESPAAESGTRVSSQRFAYDFSVSRHHDEPPECGARVITLQLVFQKDVAALVSGQRWRCGKLQPDGAASVLECIPPEESSDQGARFDVSLEIVLYELAPSPRITGEAILTLSADSGTCEHSYALNGALVRY